MILNEKMIHALRDLEVRLKELESINGCTCKMSLMPTTVKNETGNKFPINRLVVEVHPHNGRKIDLRWPAGFDVFTPLIFTLVGTNITREAIKTIEYGLVAAFKLPPF